MKISISLFLFSVIIASCTPDSKPQKTETKAPKATNTTTISPKSTGEYGLVTGEIVKIPLDDRIANDRSMGWECTNIGNKEWVYCTAMADRVYLLTLDWTNRQIHKKVNFDVEGPNGIGNLNIAYMKDFGHIVVEGSNPYRFYLSDTTRRIKKAYALQVKEALYQGCYSKFLWLSGTQKLLIPLLEQPNSAGNFTLSQPFAATLDLASGATTMLPIRYPDFFPKSKKDWDFMQADPMMLYNGTDLVYMFPAIDSIYTYNFNSKKVSSFFVKSAYKNRECEGFPLGTNQGLFGKELSESYLNNNILYDSYRKVYYKIILHPSPEPFKGRFNYKQITDAKPFSIQILDSQFNIMGETLLPTDTYLSTDVFVCKEGLAVSICHPNNKANEEDFFKFQLLKLVKNEE